WRQCSSSASPKACSPGRRCDTARPAAATCAQAATAPVAEHSARATRATTTTCSRDNALAFRAVRLWGRTAAGATQIQQSLPPRTDATGPGARVLVLRRVRRAPRRPGTAGEAPRARDPAGLDGGLDLPLAERTSPGHGTRRGRTAPVPLPPGLARAA